MGKLLSRNIGALQADSIDTPSRADHGQDTGLDRYRQIGPALDTLTELGKKGRKNHFDFAFIDADKVNYDIYYEKCLGLVRPGGVVAIDNVLWSGTVADVSVMDENTKAIRSLNAKLHKDDRIDISMVPIGDGLTLARKR